ncbi:hypothetical protein GCM10011391_20460 [Pullulanibacillus camelliae]|uniref:Glycosyltransferase family 1 protein n=1 Tax=Pullulanibacillus camelliae TaxID=1707096 RepID=A0A8J2YH79_9BACL|nr:glycosyltransferase [Pullulanibacillus camelliae]GGE41599.1 hypothetical protein GCM10011391_20460 [Pullulanibacillus camelliae]
MKVLMSPVNISGQPIELIKELRNQGVDAHLIQYNNHNYHYDTDQVIQLTSADKTAVQLKTLRDCLEDDYDIYHFWFRTLFFHRLYERFTGFDLPFIKNRGKKVIYRFTGNDLRFESEHLQHDPFSMFRYGFKNVIDEQVQKKYINFLKHYVDQFIVQDPEMQTYMPEAQIIPRVIRLEEWPFIGVKPTKRPLIVHAPSIPTAKGTEFIRQALNRLKKKGVQFDYKEISGISHEEATELYRRADLIIDGMVAGWYGVLSVECMALGKPVLVYIREDLYDAFTPQLPFEKVNLNTLEDKIEELVKDFKKRKALSIQGRAFVEEVHDIKKVTAQLISLYEQVLKSPEKTPPNNFDDINYFQHHFTELTDKAFKYDQLTRNMNTIIQRARQFQVIKNRLLNPKRNQGENEQYNEMLAIINQLKAEKNFRYIQELERLRKENQQLKRENQQFRNKNK